MIDLARAGDLDGARAVNASLKPLLDALAVTTNPIPLKAALNLVGLEVGGLRLPLVEATEQQRAAISAALETSGPLATRA
jgi:4-hydroxy-tetrahydrodipicolinate synthase